LQAAEKLNVLPYDCVMIDDAECEIEAAEKLCALKIGVAWRFHSNKDSALPNLISQQKQQMSFIKREKLKC